jgi:hypothetical protein
VLSFFHQLKKKAGLNNHDYNLTEPWYGIRPPSPTEAFIRKELPYQIAGDGFCIPHDLLSHDSFLNKKDALRKSQMIGSGTVPALVTVIFNRRGIL